MFLIWNFPMVGIVRKKLKSKEREMKMSKIILSILIVTATVSACSASSEPILSVTGLAEKTYTKNELNNFTQVGSKYMNKDGEVTEYTGISVISIIEDCGVETYSHVTLVASDGYSAEITYEELAKCERCIISFQKSEGLLAVMPEFSSKLQVRDLFELKIN